MSFVAETIVSVSIKMLVNKLVSEGFRLFQRTEQIRSDLNKWRDMLLMLKAVLRDADEEQMEEESVKLWLSELQNLAYDVEDVLEEFEYEALRMKLVLEVEPAADQPSTSKFRKLVPTCCTRFTPQSIQFDYAMMKQIQKITARFDEMAMPKVLLGSGKKLGESKKVKQRRDTTSLVNEAKVYGREKEKQELVELSMRDDLRVDDGFSVIPITGMGGLGKTTLAQLVYNDDRVTNHFDLKVWVCVSEDFDIIRVTRTILSRATEQAVNKNDLNFLQEKLKKQLSGKKFLLVLDDMWNENYNIWRDLCGPLEAGAPGSKIIVTTRNQSVVATMIGTGPAYYLKELSTDDCLRIFTQVSLGTLDFSRHPHFEEIGNKIVTKCKGLPLAAKTLGGILRGKNKLRDWEKVLNSKIWDLPEERSDILPALKVSYYYLSPRLKQCFACCSLFPKDYEFEEEEIILLWMAEVFLHDEKSKKKMEDIGGEVFHELHSRSFFQQSSSNTSRFVMHDLINDLAQWAAGKIFLRMEDALEDQEEEKFSKNLRHLSYTPKYYDIDKKFEAFYDVQHLRTLFAIPQFDTWRDRYLACSVLVNLLKFKRLRVFSLREYRIAELPSSIGDLKHLRYLDLSHSEIVTLPESINMLYNLETLVLENCRRLKKLCANMGNLIKLQHLNNSNVHSLEEMPLGIGKLTRLQTLCSFVVGKDVGSGLQELKSLKHLGKTLQISRLENVKDACGTMDAVLNGKSSLKALLFEWRSITNDSREPETETRLLDMLKPHQNLEKLSIIGYGGMRFPTWLGDSSFSKLVHLKFNDCGTCTSLPSVGLLPVLKQLFITRMDGVERVGQEFYGDGCLVPFPSLETLCFQDMEQWEEWSTPRGCSQDIGFPRLQNLSLKYCPKIVGTLPQNLPSLKSLVITQCEQLIVSIPNLPTLCELQITGSENVVWQSAINLSSMKSVMLKVSNQESLAGLFKQEMPKLEELKISSTEELACIWQSGAGLLRDISSIDRLMIEDCPQLLYLVAEEDQDQQQKEMSCRLQYLRFKQCKSLVKLPQALLSVSSLTEIWISDCNSLVSLPEVALPSQLRKITIWRCDALESLPDAWMHNRNSSLDRLGIGNCNSLTYIARVQLPQSLNWLQIIDCNNLKSLIEEEGIPSSSRRYTSVLEYLEIGGCPSLISLFSKNELPATLEHLELFGCTNLALLSPSGNLPKALKYLDVNRCFNLESIAERVDDNTSLENIRIGDCLKFKFLPKGLNKLRHLQEFCIGGCDNLVSFPEGGLLSTKLTRLVIRGCMKLEALPDGIHNLTSLQSLQIAILPTEFSFPENGFPTNLKFLEIWNPKICKQLFEWGLNRFTTLKELCLGGCPSVASFPQEEIGMTLPASLSKLMIRDFPDLQRLSSIGSLESLTLYDCPKFKFFPENPLPTSLLNLKIYGCPQIEERCRKDGGEYWGLMTRIPYVEINGKWIFEG